MTATAAMNEASMLPGEASRDHHYPGDAESIWPCEMPPPLESVEDDSEPGTLEERILRKYTPGKLALDAHNAPAPAAPAVHADTEGESNASVKACPACMGVGKVYENAAINDSTLHSTGLPSNVARVIERCCSVCNGMAIIGDPSFQKAEQRGGSDPVAAERAKRGQPIARIEKPSGVEEELDDAELEAKFGPSPFLRKKQ